MSWFHCEIRSLHEIRHNMSEIFPTELDRSTDSRLVITWNDGLQQELPYRVLRDNCPCATCREKKIKLETKRELFPILSAAEAQPLNIIGMRPVGNYAYNISFSDGHNTGIFSFEFLRAFSEEIGE